MGTGNRGPFQHFRTMRTKQEASAIPHVLATDFRFALEGGAFTSDSSVTFISRRLASPRYEECLRFSRASNRFQKYRVGLSIDTGPCVGSAAFPLCMGMDTSNRLPFAVHSTSPRYVWKISTIQDHLHLKSLKKTRMSSKSCRHQTCSSVLWT